MDTLNITFLEELAFRSATNLVYIPNKFSIGGSIPPQLSLRKFNKIMMN